MSLVGSSHYPNVYYEDMHITEDDKSKIEYLKGNIDHWISTLVHPKLHIKTYRNYYNGTRRAKDFEYLTNNFGIGSPSTLKFTNLIKRRVDALVSELESDSFSYSVSCVDDKTIDIIQENKKQAKLREIKQALERFTATVKDAVDQNKEMVPASAFKQSLSKITEKFSTNFLSDFEIAAQRVCTHFEKSNEIGLRQKLNTLAHDLIVTGEAYYRVYFTRYGSDPILEIIKPENFFHNKNTNTPFLEGTDAVVHREYLTHKEVAARYGKFMTKEQIHSLFGEKYMSRMARSLNSGLDLELYYGEDDPVLGEKHFTSAYTIEVLHVEWLATNEVEISDEEKNNQTTLAYGYSFEPSNKIRRVDRYEGTRLGGIIYVNAGKVEDVPRSQNDPYKCTFSYGGVVNNDRGGTPYSVVGALKDLQDMYDLTMFYRDNMIANSGASGDRINLAGIPKVLGADFMTRLFKFMALKKNGVELIDPTEPGAQLFQHYGSFDNSVNGQSLQAIDQVLLSIEHQADIIASTSQQMLGQIAQRDAVSNVQTGLKQTSIINQSLYELFRASHVRLMGDMIKTSQISYKVGKKISYVAGHESYTYHILPENFCFTDYALSISYASKDADKLQQLRILAKELIATQMVEPDILTRIILSDSITEVSKLITDNWSKLKAERDSVGKSESTIEQLQAELKDAQSKLSNMQQQLEASKANDSKLKEYEVSMKAQAEQQKIELDREKNKDTREFNNSQLALKEEVVQLEREQLYLGSGSAKEVKNL